MTDRSLVMKAVDEVRALNVMANQAEVARCLCLTSSPARSLSALAGHNLFMLWKEPATRGFSRYHASDDRKSNLQIIESEVGTVAQRNHAKGNRN